MYTPEAVIRLKKDNQVILTAEDAELLLSLKKGELAHFPHQSPFVTPEGNKLTLEGEEILAEYLTKSAYFQNSLAAMYRNPVPTVDGLIVSSGKILLIKRNAAPFRGSYALPGGFVEYGETLEQAVLREIKEETGLDTQISHLIGVFSAPNRDPRRHTISVAFALEILRGTPKAGDDAAAAEFFALDELPPLAFDHAEIIAKWRQETLY